MKTKSKNRKSQLEALIEESECYGKMYDAADRACKRGEAWYTCERSMHAASVNRTEAQA